MFDLFARPYAMEIYQSHLIIQTIYLIIFSSILGFKASQQSTIILDNNSSEFLTLFPNTLISGTTISMGITCQRRAVLSELFKTDGPSKAMFLGTFLHELFDFAISQKSKYYLLLIINATYIYVS